MIIAKSLKKKKMIIKKTKKYKINKTDYINYLEIARHQMTIRQLQILFKNLYNIAQSK